MPVKPTRLSSVVDWPPVAPDLTDPLTLAIRELHRESLARDQVLTVKRTGELLAERGAIVLDRDFHRSYDHPQRLQIARIGHRLYMAGEFTGGVKQWGER